MKRQREEIFFVVKIVAILLQVTLSSKLIAQSECVSISEGAKPNPKYIISDLHLGKGHVTKGGPWFKTEDFRFDETFSSFLSFIAAKGAVDLVIAGDFIDFWQIVLPGTSPIIGSSEIESLKKLEIVFSDLSHRKTFRSLERFVNQGNRLIIVPGNHDVDLNWPEVQKRLKLEFDEQSRARIFFAAPCYRGPGLHVEHGHQYDYANRFVNPSAPFVKGVGGQRLETNWGNVFVASFYNQLEEEAPFIDNLHPSTAAAWWALTNEPIEKFALPQVGKLAVMLLRDQVALDNLGYLVHTLGEDNTPSSPKTSVDNVDELAALYSKADPQVASALRQLLQDQQHRADAESALAELSEGERTVQISRSPDPTLGNFIRGGDPYERAARRIAIANKDVMVVVMGHTHDLDRAIQKLDKVQGQRWYANTGCWQKSLLVRDARARGWKNLDLDDQSMFKERFSYVKVEYNGGQIQEPTRGFWP